MNTHKEKLQKNAPHIVHWIWGLSLGGDAKNLVALAKEQKSWAQVSVLTQLEQEIARQPDLLEIDIPVTTGIATKESLSAFIEKEKPDLFIMHRNGANNPLETGLLTILNEHEIPVFEYNTFARPDPETDSLFTGHAQLSRAAFLQYCARHKKSLQELKNHRAIGYALEPSEPISPQERDQAREALGIEKADLVVSRLQRPDLRKWDPLPVLAIEKLVKQGLNIYFLVQTPPKERLDWLKTIASGHIIAIEPSTKPEILRRTLACSDYVLNYSAIGETFGLAIAEAMMLERPVIANSTPFADNAQVELCQPESGSFIANSVQELCFLLSNLAKAKTNRDKLGAQSREFILRNFQSPLVELRLRKFMKEQLAAQNYPLAEKITVPNFNDPYVLDQPWLDEFKSKITEPPKPKTETANQFGDSKLDEIKLKLLRLEDYALFLRQLPPWELYHKVSERLKKGKLRRL